VVNHGGELLTHQPEPFRVTQIQVKAA